MSKKQLENLLTHLPQQALTYFASPKPSPPILPSLRPPGLLCKPASQSSASPGNPVHLPQCPPPLNALKPSLGHSSSASPAGHKAPSGQIWAHFRHWTCWIKPGFGPKFISGNFIEISTNSSDSMQPWKKEGKVCAYFPTATSSQSLGKILQFSSKLFPSDNAMVAHQSKLLPAVI